MEVQTIWSDDGIAIRLPEGDATLDGVEELLFPDPEEVEDLVVGQVASSALFASRFRENAARALLLPRRRPGTRTPLWQQRQRAAGLLAVASRYGSFPILVETYRECLSDVFDLPGAARGARRRGPARHRGPQRRDPALVPVRELAAVRLRRRLHVRRRRTAGRAAGRRPDARPRPAARAARAGGAARAARCRGARRPRAVAAGADRRSKGLDRRPGPRPAPTRGRPDARGGGRPQRRRGRGGRPLARGARPDAACGARPDRERGSLDRDGGRRPIPRRDRRPGTGRRAERVPRPGRQRARRPARPLGTHARPVPDARAGASLGDAAAGRGGCPRTAARRGHDPARRVPAGRRRARVVRPGRAAPAPPAVPGAPAARGRAGRSGSARAVPSRLAWRRCGGEHRDPVPWLGRPRTPRDRRRPARRPRDPGVGPRARRPACPHPRLPAAAAGRAGVARRGRLGGAREPRPRRRAHRAVPPGQGGAPAGHAPRRRPSGPPARATTRSASTWPAAAPRSTARSTRLPAAAPTATCSTRCGTSCGPARSRTTPSRRFVRCAGSGPVATRGSGRAA